MICTSKVGLNNQLIKVQILSSTYSQILFVRIQMKLKGLSP